MKAAASQNILFISETPFKNTHFFLRRPRTGGASRQRQIDHYTLEPVAYGLKFAGALCGSKLVKADLTAQIQTTGVEGTAYAARLPGNTTTVMILNKDAVRDLDLTFDFAEVAQETDAFARGEVPSLHPLAEIVR